MAFRVPFRSLATEFARAFATKEDAAYRRLGGLIDRNFEDITSNLNSGWIPYSPATSGLTEGSGGVTEAAYKVIGSTCFFRYGFTLGAGSAVTGAVLIDFPTGFVPVAQGTGSAAYSDSSAFALPVSGAITWAAGGTAYTLSQPSGYVNATNPFTWASGDIIRVSGFFEIT